MCLPMYGHILKTISAMRYNYRLMRKMFYFLIFLLGCWFIINLNLNTNEETKLYDALEKLSKEKFPNGDKSKLKEIGDVSEWKSLSDIIGRKRYAADWSDLVTRPLPEWYDRAKIGIMVHWGVYSVPAYQSEYFWMLWKKEKENFNNFMRENYKPEFTYEEFAPMLKAQLFDPHYWATLFRNAGARYVVLTSKHHDGYTLFPSKQSPNWNSVDVGPRRDIVGELSKAVREKGLEFGVYYSLFEWHSPIYNQDKDAKFSTYNYRDNKLFPEFKQLIKDYEPSVIWSDGDIEAQDRYWNSTKLLAWLYNESPVRNQVVVNDRWGHGTLCNCGDFYTCSKEPPFTLQKHKWENAFSLDALSFGYRQDMNIYDVLSVQQLIKKIIRTVSHGGNVLINVGASKEGTIPLIFQDRLLSLGKWLAVNGEAIFDTSPWFHQGDRFNKGVWYTCLKEEYDGQKPTGKPKVTDNVTAIYAMFTRWPKDDILKLADISHDIKKNFKNSAEVLFEFLDYPELYLNWTISKGLNVKLPSKSKVISNHAWVLKISVVSLKNNKTLVTTSK